MNVWFCVWKKTFSGMKLVDCSVSGPDVKYQNFKITPEWRLDLVSDYGYCQVMNTPWKTKMHWYHHRSNAAIMICMHRVSRYPRFNIDEGLFQIQKLCQQNNKLKKLDDTLVRQMLTTAASCQNSCLWILQFWRNSEILAKV